MLNVIHYAEFRYAECCYAECCYGECHGAKVIPSILDETEKCVRNVNYTTL
jgi:hypothetical protein